MATCQYTLLVIILMAMFVSGDDNDELKGKVESPNSWSAYKALLQTQRKAQLEAIKTLISSSSNEKLYNMLDVLTKALIDVLAGAKKGLEEVGYFITDGFPQDDATRDNLSKVIQNAIMFGDMALRFPNFIHKMYNRNSNAKSLIKWAFDFTERTKVAVGTSAEQTIPLASQELYIRERSKDYVNPYKDETEIKISQLVQEEIDKQKKKNKKKKRGPRLSKKTEL